VDKSFTVCFPVCVFVRLRTESQICENFAPPESQNRTNRIAREPRHPHVNIIIEMRQRKRPARDARGVWTLDRHMWIYVSPTDILVRYFAAVKVRLIL